MISKSIILNKNQFILHPSGAVYWKDEDMLLIADVHFGKIMHFRKHGSAVPNEALYENFKRLNSVIKNFNPKSVYFLGDLFHSALNSEWLLFVNWINTQTCAIVLITGNHDIISPIRYTKIGIKLLDAFKHNQFLLTHYPTNSITHFNIAGHIHPGIIIKGKGKQRISVPCFQLSKLQLILPAFGTFTGKYIINPKNEDTIYATTGDEVILIDSK